MGTPLPLGLTAGSLLSQGDDVYVTVRISIDTKRHVAPISSTPIITRPIQATSTTTIAESKIVEAPARENFLKFRTITKYSYFESGDKWIKVLLPDLANLSSHPSDKVKVEFLSQRSFSVTVMGFKGQNW